MPAAQVTVLYPQSPTSTFDMSYYLATHMPLVTKLWGPYGLKNYTILQFGPDAPYSVQATLFWDQMEDFEKAGQAEGAKEVMADIVNFSSVKPVLMAGGVVKSG